MKKGICRHCGAEAVGRPRGLGWRCYYTPSVRAMYPPMPSAEAGRKGGSRPKPQTRVVPAEAWAGVVVVPYDPLRGILPTARRFGVHESVVRRAVRMGWAKG